MKGCSVKRVAKRLVVAKDALPTKKEVHHDKADLHNDCNGSFSWWSDPFSQRMTFMLQESLCELKDASEKDHVLRDGSLHVVQSVNQIHDF